MSRLPRITGREALRVLERAGFNLVRIRAVIIIWNIVPTLPGGLLRQYTATG